MAGRVRLAHGAVISIWKSAYRGATVSITVFTNFGAGFSLQHASAGSLNPACLSGSRRAKARPTGAHLGCFSSRGAA